MLTQMHAYTGTTHVCECCVFLCVTPVSCACVLCMYVVWAYGRVRVCSCPNTHNTNTQHISRTHMRTSTKTHANIPAACNSELCAFPLAQSNGKFQNYKKKKFKSPITTVLVVTFVTELMTTNKNETLLSRSARASPP